MPPELIRAIGILKKARYTGVTVAEIHCNTSERPLRARDPLREGRQHRRKWRAGCLFRSQNRPFAQGQVDCKASRLRNGQPADYAPNLCHQPRARATISISASPTAIDDMLEFSARHSIAPITETLPMSKVNDAFERLRSGKARYRLVLENENRSQSDVCIIPLICRTIYPSRWMTVSAIIFLVFRSLRSPCSPR